MRRAFTLIELLVVIAIIAILAAILFPVFAQAKLAAKKTAGLSNAKQTGTAIVLYTTDADDGFPNGMLPNLADPSKVQYVNGGASAIPAGWTTQGGYGLERDSLVWGNSTQPYRKSYEALKIADPNAIEIKNWKYDSSQPGKAETANFAFNGYLSYLGTTEIASPSVSPLIWQGIGKAQRRGLHSTSPRLVCNGTGPCRFNPTGPPQADGKYNALPLLTYFDKNSVWGFGQGALYVASDSSAKFVRVGAGNANRANNVVPWSSLDPATGLASDENAGVQYWGCSLDGASAMPYVMAFRPDNDYSESFARDRCK